VHEVSTGVSTKVTMSLPKAGHTGNKTQGSSSHDLALASETKVGGKTFAVILVLYRPITHAYESRDIFSNEDCCLR
jgi:hypothetical protein